MNPHVLSVAHKPISHYVVVTIARAVSVLLAGDLTVDASMAEALTMYCVKPESLLQELLVVV